MPSDRRRLPEAAFQLLEDGSGIETGAEEGPSTAGPDVVYRVRTIVRRNETAWMSVLSDEELRAYIELHHRIQDSLAASPES